MTNETKWAHLVLKRLNRKYEAGEYKYSPEYLVRILYRKFKSTSKVLDIVHIAQSIQWIKTI